MISKIIKKKENVYIVSVIIGWINWLYEHVIFIISNNISHFIKSYLKKKNLYYIIILLVWSIIYVRYFYYALTDRLCIHKSNTNGNETVSQASRLRNLITMEIDAHRTCIVMLLSSYNEYTRRFVFAADIFVYELPLDVFEIAEFSYYAKTISARALVAAKHCSSLFELGGSPSFIKRREDV